MKVWPEEPQLGAVFPENRVKYAMRWGRRILPPFIVFMIVWNFIEGGGLKGVSFMYTLQSHWPVTIVCVLFLLLMPLQGYYWFGRRSKLPLTKKQQLFYIDVCKRLGKEPKLKPEMMDLALIIREGIDKLGRDFLKNV